MAASPKLLNSRTVIAPSINNHGNTKPMHINFNVNHDHNKQNISAKDVAEFQCHAIEDYLSTNSDDELTLISGAKYTITQTSSSGWWYAVDCNGDSGWVPSNYLMSIDGKSMPPNDKLNLFYTFNGELNSRVSVSKHSCTVSDLRQVILSRLNGDGEALDTVYLYYEGELLSNQYALLSEYNICNNDIIAALTVEFNKQIVSDKDMEEQMLEYLLKVLKVWRRPIEDPYTFYGQIGFKMNITSKHINSIRKFKILYESAINAKGTVLQRLVDELGIVEVSNLLTMYQKKFELDQDAKASMFYLTYCIYNECEKKFEYKVMGDDGKEKIEHSSYKIKSSAYDESLNYFQYKVIEVDDSDNICHEFIYDRKQKLVLKYYSKYKIYFRDKFDEWLLFQSIPKTHSIHNFYGTFLSDHLEMKNDEEIVFKFFAEDQAVNVNIIKEILDAKYIVKCSKHNNKNNLIVFGFIRNIQEKLFADHINAAFFNIPHGIYVKCLAFVDDHFMMNKSQTFDDINDFKIIVSGHKKCVMPTFELYALPKGYSKNVFIKKFYLSDDRIKLHFELMKVIGRGSFAKVFQVKRKIDNKIFALKRVKKVPCINKNQIEHTNTERKVLEMTDHPFLVHFHYSFETAAKLFFVLDFYYGGELFFHLKKHRRFSEDVARIWVAEVGMALGYLHSLNIMYRGAKPEDILLDENGHICLTDFGLSKQFGPNENRTNTFCGTPEYLAPEIVMLLGHNKMCDWWCLGILLYELTVGIPPFYSQNVNEMYRKIQEAPLLFPPNLSTQCKNIITKLLQRDPKKRLGSNNDFRDIMKHPFFSCIDWVKLYNKEIPSGFVPKVNGIDDVSNFDSMFVAETVIMEPTDPPKTLNADDLFKDWWYEKPMNDLQL